MAGESSEPLSERLADAAWLCVLSIAALGPLLTTNLTLFGIGTYPATLDQHFLIKAILVAVASFTAGGLAALSIVAGRKQMRTATPLWLLAAFLLLAVASAAFSGERAVSLVGTYAHYEGLLMLFAYAALFLAVMNLVTAERLRLLVRVTMISGALVALYGALQMFGLDPANWLEADFTLTRAFSTWGNPDFLGGYLMVPLAFSAVLAVTDDSRVWRAVSTFCFGLIVLALIGTVTRGAWIAGAITLAFIAVALTRAGWHPVGFRSAAVLGAAVAAYISTGGTHRVVNRVVMAAAPSTDNGVTGRVNIWGGALKAILHRPLLGGGPDTYEQSTTPLTGFMANDAHNHFLQMAVTVGLPAALALWGAFAWIVAGTSQLALRPGKDSSSALRTALWAAVVGGLFAWLLVVAQTVSTALPLICLAVLLRMRSNPVAVSRKVVTAVGAAALVLAVVSASLGVRGLAADAAYMKARIADHEGGDRLTHARRAVELNPLFERYRKELALAEGEAERGQR